jgi:hypothetical protein
MPRKFSINHIGLLALLIFSFPLFSSNGSTVFFASLNSLVGQQEYHLQAAPVYQDTGYPSESTTPPYIAYPEEPTATEFVEPTFTEAPLPDQATEEPTNYVETILPTQTLQGTLSPLSETPNNPFLTENAEMGQSQATPLPSETATPTSTSTITSTPNATPEVIVDQGFHMDWGGFSIGLLGMVVLGGGVSWWMLRRRMIKIEPEVNHHEPPADQPQP